MKIGVHVTNIQILPRIQFEMFIFEIFNQSFELEFWLEKFYIVANE